MTIRDGLTALGALGGLVYIFNWLYLKIWLWNSGRKFKARNGVSEEQAVEDAFPPPEVHGVACSHCGKNLPWYVYASPLSPNAKPTCKINST